MQTINTQEKWRTLLLLSLAELLAMVVWFSASAVTSDLTELWQLDAGGQAWLTMSVQIGFVVGAVASAILTLADRIPARWPETTKRTEREQNSLGHRPTAWHVRF